MAQYTPPSTPSGSRIMMNMSLTHGVMADTAVLTCAGEKPARHLKVGERIITRDRGAIPLKTLVRRTPNGRQRMVRIPANAFGIGRPSCDMDVLPDQPVVIRDWRSTVLYGHSQARVAAQRLVDHTIVRDIWRAPEPVVSLHFAAPSVIYVNGLELLSAGLAIGGMAYRGSSGGSLSI